MKDITTLFNQYKQEIPGIVPFEDDGMNLFDESRQAQKSGDLATAEKLLKKLILLQPEHHDGYEFLALLYEKQNNSDAVALIEKAYEIAYGFYEEDELDKVVLDEISQERESIIKHFKG